MSPEDEIQEAIQKLSQKKHVISEESLNAKAKLDQMKSSVFDQFETQPGHKKKLAIIDEFSKSVKMLSAIFQESGFDELALMLSHPNRILIMNVFIGITRGIGFMIGILLVTGVLAILIKETYPNDWGLLIQLIVAKLKSYS